MSRTNDLGRDEIPRLVVRLAIPTMLAQLVNVLYSIVDRMYIGTGVGDLALAGVGICAPIVTLLASFGSMVGLAIGSWIGCACSLLPDFMRFAKNTKVAAGLGIQTISGAPKGLAQIPPA